jgi:thiosulfate reductase cytochrome b subunit
MQAITILGLALCLGVLFQRARKARKQAPSSISWRFKTAHLLFAALLAWLVITMQLQHLNRALSGEPQAPRSTWERLIQTLSDWGI